jgi:protoporphyrinogen oxidase
MMDIAIVGAGLTGLTAAYSLTKQGHTVTVFEKEPFVGGLAHGFKPATRSLDEEWAWPLEIFYHHIFTNDTAIINLVHELKLDSTLVFQHPMTSTLIPNYDTLYPLDSPITLLTFSPIPLFARLQTGIMLALCKINPFWQPLENMTAEQFIKTYGGDAGWHTIWEPLLYGKFGPYAHKIAASWFWARIKKRTPRLGYFQGGFQTVAEELAQAIRKNGGVIQTGITIAPIKKDPKTKLFSVGSAQFDTVLLTVPSPIATKLYPNFPKSTIQNLQSIPHLWAQTLILETKQPILKDVYWLNINDRSFPFLSMVAHTNFMDKRNYGGNHITYLGNYLPDGHPYLSMDKEQLLKIFLPFVQRINPKFLPAQAGNIQNLKSYLFTAPNAQPVHALHYSRQAPAIHTSVEGLFLANMDSIYPWDRGTNYAVELGMRAADLITKKTT